MNFTATIRNTIAIFASLGLWATSLHAEESIAPMVIHDFNPDQDSPGWRIQDDRVMGGVSQGKFTVSDKGHGVFYGDVSLEQNGGFSSVQYYFDRKDISGYETAHIRLKGDGKKYHFIVEGKEHDRHYYQTVFETGTDWETIEVPLKEMIPVFRGDRIDRPNFPAEILSQVRFLIANGRAESFRLEIDKVWLE